MSKKNKYQISNSTDYIEIQSTDELDGPNSGGLRGSTRVWFKTQDNKWIQSSFRSEYKCNEAILKSKTIKEAKQAICEHSNTILKREGTTGILGRVICKDCGHEREWNAY